MDVASGVAEAKARNGTEAAAARRTRAVFAAEIGAMIRGDLWAEAAFTGARFMGTDRSTSLDGTNSGQLARARANADTALALAAVNGAACFFFARLPASSQDGENRVGTLLEMSYFTAPSALNLTPLAPRTRGNLKRARGQGPPSVRQERYSRDSGSRDRISGRLSQRLAAEPADFEITCGRCRSGRGPIASLRPAKMKAVGQLRRLPGKPVLNSLVLQVPRGSTFKLAPRAESRRPRPRAKTKRNRSVPPIPQ